MSDCTKNYQVAAYECDQESILTPPTIFNWLQDSMDQFTRIHNVGQDFCHAKDLTYMLKAYDVQINQLPHWGETVQMHTTLCDVGASSLFFKQDLYDQTCKQQLFSAASHLVLIDLLKGHPARIKDCLPPDLLETIHIPLTFTALKPLDRVHSTRSQEITTDYIDFNQHVNNTHYVTFAERALDPVFLKKAKLKRIQVAYKNAAKLGDKAKVETKIAPGFTDHQIVSEDDANKLFARVRFSWARKER